MLLDQDKRHARGRLILWDPLHPQRRPAPVEPVVPVGPVGPVFPSCASRFQSAEGGTEFVFAIVQM